MTAGGRSMAANVVLSVQWWELSRSVHVVVPIPEIGARTSGRIEMKQGRRWTRGSGGADEDEGRPEVRVRLPRARLQRG